MLALNLPGFAPKVAEKDGKRTIFDPVRQKYVALTPEEWVRQHFVNYLITQKKLPERTTGKRSAGQAEWNIQTLRHGCLQPLSGTSGHRRVQSPPYKHYQHCFRPDSPL